MASLLPRHPRLLKRQGGGDDDDNQLNFDTIIWRNRDREIQRQRYRDREIQRQGDTETAIGDANSSLAYLDRKRKVGRRT